MREGRNEGWGERGGRGEEEQGSKMREERNEGWGERGGRGDEEQGRKMKEGRNEGWGERSGRVEEEMEILLTILTSSILEKLRKKMLTYTMVAASATQILLFLLLYLQHMFCNITLHYRKIFHNASYTYCTYYFVSSSL